MTANKSQTKDLGFPSMASLLTCPIPTTKEALNFFSRRPIKHRKLWIDWLMFSLTVAGA